MERFDVIVVGLGAAGSATVYHLARSGARVLGIDRFSPPHDFGSSHGDTRITREAVGEGAQYVPFVRRSHELWRELEAETGTTLLEQTGGVVLAPESGAGGMHGAEDFLEATVQVSRTHGIEHEVIGRDDVPRRFPQFRFDEPHVAYYEPGAGFVRAEDAVRAHLDAAARRGATIHRNERVLEVHPSTDGVTVRTAHGRYGADGVVLAAGAWLPTLVEPGLAAMFTVYRQTVAWYRLGTGHDAFDPARCPVFIWKFGPDEQDLCYGFPAVDGPNGGIKIGTERYDESTDPDTVERTVDPAEVSEPYDWRLRDRIPALRRTVLRSSTCLYTVTPDFGFVLDRHPEHRTVVLAAVCSGHGFKHSAAVGEAVSQLVTGGTTAIDLAPFAIRRFTAAGV